MRILYITNGYPPLRWAGTETYTAGMAEGFLQKGHDVQVLCAGTWNTGSDYWNGISEDVQKGVHVRRINLNWTKSPDPFRYLYDNPVVAEYLGRLLTELMPDIVHFTSCETLSASGLQVVRDAGIPLVLSLTDFWFLCPRINLLHGEGHNCSGQTTAAQCLDCTLLLNRTYRRAKKIVPAAILSPMLGMLSQYPSVTRVRGFRGLMGDMAGRKAFLKRALSLPDHRVTASEFVRGIFLDNGVSSEITVQPYGHDLGWLEGYSGKAESDVIRLGYVGQILDSKGVHLILQAFALLPESLLAKFTLTIYGNLDHTPAYGRQIKEMAAQFPNVRFGGVYPHSESARIFSGIDLLVVPSLWYDFPLVIFEAFATQTPVIATNLGGMAESVNHERSGLLFERGDAGDLARQFERIAGDRGFLERLAGGVPPVKEIGDELDEFERIYQRLLQKNRPVVSV